MAGRGYPRSHIDSSEEVELPLCALLEHAMRNGDGSPGGRRLIISPARTSALWQLTCLERFAVLEQAVPDLLRTACDGRNHASMVWMARVDVGVCEARMMSSSRKHSGSKRVLGKAGRDFTFLADFLILNSLLC